MNQVYSTKDKENLLIDEDMMNEEFRALAFMYNTENGTIQVKIARDNEKDVIFTIDSLKAMKSLAYFIFDKYKEAEALAASGVKPTNVKLNDQAVQSLWIKMNQEGKDIKS